MGMVFLHVRVLVALLPLRSAHPVLRVIILFFAAASLHRALPFVTADKVVGKNHE